MKFIIFVFLLVGMAAADCDFGKCFGKADSGLANCKQAGMELGKKLNSAKNIADMNKAYEEFCVNAGCQKAINSILSLDMDCDCLSQDGRINSATIDTVCTKDGKNFVGTRFLAAINTPNQCGHLSKNECEANANCMYEKSVERCVFNPSVDNLNQMCNAELMEYLLKNPTGGAFSGTDSTPLLLSTILTFCLKQGDQYCVLSSSKLPLKMTKEELDEVCGNSTKLACARSRLAVVAASFRVAGINDSNTKNYEIANSLDHAAQDLCVKEAENYCLNYAGTLATCNCTNKGQCASKKILGSCCGKTIQEDNLLLSNDLSTKSMEMLYSYSASSLNIPKADHYNVQTLLNNSDNVAKTASKEKIDEVNCDTVTISTNGCITPSEKELGKLIATISQDLNETLKEMLPVFIKTDLAIQLAVPFYTLDLTAEKTDDVQFYVDFASKKIGGIKYTIKINAEESIVKGAQEKFKKMSGNLHFFLTGAFLSINGNGALVSGVLPLLLTKEQFDNATGKTSADSGDNTTTAESANKVGESTWVLAFTTVMVALFVL